MHAVTANPADTVRVSRRVLKRGVWPDGGVAMAVREVV